MTAYNIRWDTTDEEAPVRGHKVDLPKTVKLPYKMSLDEVADWLSDKYGWCINSLEVK